MLMKQNTLTWNPCWPSQHWGTEAGESQVLGQTELHREVKVTLGYKVRLCLKQKEENGIPSSASGYWSQKCFWYRVCFGKTEESVRKVRQIDRLQRGASCSTDKEGGLHTGEMLIPVLKPERSSICFSMRLLHTREGPSIKS